MNKTDMDQRFLKIVLLITGAIFTGVLVCSLCANTVLNIAVDASIYVTAISVTGVIFGSSILWYFFDTAKKTAYDCKICLSKEVYRGWLRKSMHKQ
jgi:hypothetical protein